MVTWLMQSTHPTVTSTQFDGGQGKAMSVQDFLRGLKRPVSKSTLPSVFQERSTITKDMPKPDLRQVKTMSSYNLLGSSRRLALATVLPSPIDESKSVMIKPQDGLLFTESWTETLRVMGPPESSAEESIDYTQQDPTSSLKAEKAKAIYEATEVDDMKFLEAPKVVRTYVNKARQTTSRMESLPDTSQLFCTQSPAADHENPSDDQDTGSQTEAKAFSKTEDRETYMPKGQELQFLEGSMSQTLYPMGETKNESTNLSAAVTCTEKTTRKRKRRRAPIDELALRATHLNKTATHNSYKDHLDSHKRPKSILKNAGIVKSGDEANIAKLMTKYRGDTVLFRRDSIDPHEFRFPPMTPKATKSPGRKLGSGFEGISIELSNSAHSALPQRNAKRAKTVRFTLTPLRPLELTTKIPPAISDPRTKHALKMPQNLTVPPLTSPRQPRREGRSYEKYKQCPVTPTPVSNPEISLQISRTRTESNHTIRPPSKSERTGWLKRRRISSSHNADALGMMLEVEYGNPTNNNDDAERFFASYDTFTKGVVELVCSPKPPCHESAELESLEVEDSYEQSQRCETESMLLDELRDDHVSFGEEFVREAMPDERVEKLGSTGRCSNGIVRCKSQAQMFTRRSRS